MKAKEYLQQLKRFDTVIHQKMNEIQDLRLKSQSIGSIDCSKEAVQTSSSGDASFAKLINRIIDLETEIETEIEKYACEKHKIINQIQTLEQTKHIDILYKRYVEFKRLQMIAVEMNFTYQYVVELHGYALKEFQRTYKNL